MDFVTTLPFEISIKIFRILGTTSSLFKYLALSKAWFLFLTHHRLVCLRYNDFLSCRPGGTIDHKLRYMAYLQNTYNVRIEGMQVSALLLQNGIPADKLYTKFYSMISQTITLEVLIDNQRPKEFVDTMERLFTRAHELRHLMLTTPSCRSRVISYPKILFKQDKNLACGRIITDVTKNIHHLEVTNGVWFAKTLPIMFTALSSLVVNGSAPYSIVLEIVANNSKLKALKLKNIDIRLCTVIETSLRNPQVAAIFGRLTTFGYWNATNERILKLHLNDYIYGREDSNGDFIPIFSKVSHLELFGFAIREKELSHLFFPTLVTDLSIDDHNLLASARLFKNLRSTYIRLRD